MDEKDIVTQTFWSDNERFADIINAGIFYGKYILQGKELENEESAATTIQGKKRMRVAAKKYRDVIKKVAFGSEFVLIGIENQSEVHYAMPVRVMGYDFLGYDEQLRKIKKEHRKKGDLKGTEYLSGFAKGDKLKPIFTLVLYYGDTPWDGPEMLSDVLEWKDVPQEIRGKIADYPIHIIDVRRFEESENLRTDARLVFGFLKRQNDGKALKEYIEENEEDFSKIYEDAYDMISVLTNSKELMDVKKECISAEGGFDMCEAMRQWKEEEREEGREEGEDTFAMLTDKLLKDSRTEDLLRAIEDKSVRNKLYQEYGIKNEK